MTAELNWQKAFEEDKPIIFEHMQGLLCNEVDQETFDEVMQRAEKEICLFGDPIDVTNELWYQYRHDTLATEILRCIRVWAADYLET